MEINVRTMCIEKNTAIISKYEVMKAFFLTEEEDNIDMADELNKMINVFYEHERQTMKNVTSLSFDTETYEKAINYIKRACI